MTRPDAANPSFVDQGTDRHPQFNAPQPLYVYPGIARRCLEWNGFIGPWNVMLAVGVGRAGLCVSDSSESKSVSLGDQSCISLISELQVIAVKHLLDAGKLDATLWGKPGEQSTVLGHTVDTWRLYRRCPRGHAKAMATIASD